jgi:hypothetical protein
MPTPVPPLLLGLPTLAARQWLLPISTSAEHLRELMAEAMRHLEAAAAEGEPFHIEGDAHEYESPLPTERQQSLRAALEALNDAEELLRKEVRADLNAARALLGVLPGLLDAQR